MATSGLRIEEFNPRSQSRPQGRFWFEREIAALTNQPLAFSPHRSAIADHDP